MRMSLFRSFTFTIGLTAPRRGTCLLTPCAAEARDRLRTQLAVSRDGLNWRRYPRPAYVGIGEHAGRDVKTAYIAHGMVRRGD